MAAAPQVPDGRGASASSPRRHPSVAPGFELQNNSRSSLDIDGVSSAGRRSPSVLSSVNSAKVYRPRRASVSGNSNQGTAGSFLSRFMSSFRSPLTNAPRPSLSRSLSTPGGGLAPRQPTGGAGSSISSSSSIQDSPKRSRFRPSFRRRATTGSPNNSPTGSPVNTPPEPVGSAYSRERDPMEGAFQSLSRESSKLRVADADGRPIHQRSTSTNGRGRSSPSALPPSSPLSRHTFDATTPRVDESSVAGRIQNPLAVITALLPPGLLLLSQLGPQHLYSPPSLLPPDITIPLPSPASSTAPYISSDRASIASSQTSFSSYPSLPTVVLPAHSFTHELHAPSTISLPAVSAAAVWRLFKGFEWITEMANGVAIPSTPPSDEDEVTKIFDFPSLLQGVADILAADAAVRGVEIILGITGRGSDSATESNKPSPDLVRDPARPEESLDAMASRELLVRAEERAWGVVLAWALSTVLTTAPAGSTVTFLYRPTLAAAPPPHANHETSFGSQETAIPTRKSLQQWWTISLELRVTLPPQFRLSHPLAQSPFSTDFARSLFSYLNIKVTPTPIEGGITSWSLQALLPEAKPIIRDLQGSSSLLGRRRATLAAAGQEPNLTDLIEFVATGLKGVKISLHAGTHSTFGRHISAYLAEWGMDVSHTPLDSEGIPADPPLDRHHDISRFDSGFGSVGMDGLPASASFASELGNQKGVGDLPSPGSSSATSSGDSTPSNFIIIDDDIATLRRFLFAFRQPFAPHLGNKRPPLANRRTRSSPHVRQLNQAASAQGLVIVHFASLNRYKAIKELVQDALATSRSPHLPEVLVIPKPAGPRRILTAIWTAFKRPAVDPSLPPIATAPSSPGSQYWSQKLSPALSNQQDFDSSAPEALAGKGDYSVKPRTPPSHFPHATAGHPPSPLGKISDDQVSYFSCVAEGLDGTSPSEGVVIQNPDGRPALFFQPQTRSSRVSSARTHRSFSVDKDGSSKGSPSSEQAPVVTPQEIGLGSGRPVSTPSSVSGADSPALVGTPALPLASLITAAMTRTQPEENLSAGDDDSSAAEGPPPLSRQPSLAHLQTRQSIRSSVIPRAPPERRPSAASGSGTPRQVPTSIADPKEVAPTAPLLTGRRSSGSASHRSRRNTARKATIPTVPPISVLIVEDNPINQMILAMFMKKKGIKYAVAKDGEEAVQKWKDGNFHLVLMDIQLPVKDGIEATRDIRQLERAANNERLVVSTPSSDAATSPSLTSTSNPLSSPTTPLLKMPVIIVALTASSLQIDRVTALAAGCNDFLTKPVSLPWLQQKLLEWGSMAYLSGFSRHGSADSMDTAGQSESGLNSKAASISAHLHIEAKTTKSFVGRPSISGRTASFRASGLGTGIRTPVTPAAVESNPVANEVKPTDLNAVDLRLGDLASASTRRPGLSPITPSTDPALENVVAEGERLVDLGKNRAGSLGNVDSISSVINGSGSVPPPAS